MPVIGTAGHVDHGKSALVQALTGIDPDRLREEKERGLTIDLGFAWLELPSGLEAGIVDVPGHERFIKNMLAGAGGIDLALLVVAADEGPRPQTREHLAILDLLEVPTGIVVITKTDLVEDEYLELVEAELAEVLEGSRLERAPILRVSAKTGLGLAELKAAVDSILASSPAKRDLNRGRLPIDRAFTIQGFGAVVTGTLIDGSLEVGQEVELLPQGIKARIRGLQRHKSKVDRADPGTRVAVNLSGVRTEEISRGMVVARPGAVSVANSVVVRLTASRILAHPLGHDAEMTVLCATAETQAKVRLLDADVLARGEECWAQLVFATPVAVALGDHVVVRSPNETVAGGPVVLVNSPRLRRNHPATLEKLDRLRSGGTINRVRDQLATGPATLPSLATSLNIPVPEASEAVAELVASGEALQRNGTVMATNWLRNQLESLDRALAEFAAANPLRRAAPKEHLRAATRLSPANFELVVGEATAGGAVETRGSGIAPAGYQPTLTPQQQSQADQFLARLEAEPYSPPTEGLPPQPLLAYLSEARLIEVTPAGVVFAKQAFDEMVRRTRVFAASNGSISLAETRDLFGTSRKYAQAFLEHLDALQVTRRTGDTRTLR
ncbi:MAG: selenocysteine-specific translation elongation factor [Dehalococcoidia bacterium]